MPVAGVDGCMPEDREPSRGQGGVSVIEVDDHGSGVVMSS